MNLLEDFCNYIGLNMYIGDNDNDIECTTDSSEYNVVDGEEGDYGILKYYSLDGKLLAVRTVYGGDDEDVEFTTLCKSILREKVLSLIDSNIDNLLPIIDYKNKQS